MSNAPEEENEEYTSELQDELDSLREVFEMFAAELTRITFVRGDVTVPATDSTHAFTLTYQPARAKDKNAVYALNIAIDNEPMMPLKDTQVKYRIAAAAHLGALADNALSNSAKTIADLRAARALTASVILKLKKEPTR